MHATNAYSTKALDLQHAAFIHDYYPLGLHLIADESMWEYMNKAIEAGASASGGSP